MRISLLLLALSPLVSCGQAPQTDSSQTSVYSNGVDFPAKPVGQLTPGSRCHSPVEFRYPDRVAYCGRDVSTKMKRLVIAAYDNRFGYSIGKMKRKEFTIDHYIPLSIGGSNDMDNLWPQHDSVNSLTDPVEHLLYELISRGRITQEKAIEAVREAKGEPEYAPDIAERLRSMF